MAPKSGCFWHGPRIRRGARVCLVGFATGASGPNEEEAMFSARPRRALVAYGEVGAAGRSSAELETLRAEAVARALAPERYR
jgi:hypothetical protein